MLKGKYIGLRAVEKDDLAQLLEWRNRTDYRRFFREYRELNMAQQITWFEGEVLKNPRVIMFSIVNLETGALMGACGLCYIDWINRNADFSIYLGYNDIYIDDKYAIDVAHVFLNHAFNYLNFHRIWAEIYSIDDRKKKFFESLGFSLDGRHRETYWCDGKWHDSLFYGILSTEFSYQ